jgi:hypothetical protein
MKNNELRIVSTSLTLGQAVKTGSAGGSFIILYSLFTILSFCGCQRTNEAVGREDVIIVISEEENRESVKEHLARNLEAEEPYSLERRRQFNLEWISPENFHRFRFRKNLLLMGILEQDSLIQELLTDKAKEEVISRQAQVFEKRDAWATDQSLLIITATNQDSLISIVKTYAEVIHRFYVEEVRRRTEQRIYGDGYEEELAGRLKESYGWSIQLPRGYQVAREDSSGQFVQFIRHFPDRIITVYWEKRDIPFQIRECLGLRDSLARKYFDGDIVMRDRVRGDSLDFEGRKTLRLTGYWENEEKVIGGPFITFCFIQGGLFYFLDLHIFAPGEKKWLYLLQLEQIAKTFDTK